MPAPSKLTDRAGTGISGLDCILEGGLPRERVYLVHGAAGTGKTTLGFHFLMEGAANHERVLYVTLLQDRVNLEDIAASHGWSLDGIDILEVSTQADDHDAAEQTVFSPADVELKETVDTIIEGIETIKPQRLVLDSISELAILADSRYRLRRHILRLKETLAEKSCTAVFTAGDAEESVLPLRTVVHGVVGLDARIPPYGNPRRRLEVSKMRGMNYRGGYHDFCIHTGGIQVFPRLQVAPSRQHLEWPVVSSGVEKLDGLFGGGLEEGTACLITGTTGAGKSTLASLYVQAAAERGERSAVFCFDERKETFVRRLEMLELDLAKHIESGVVDLQQIDVGEISAGQFVYAVTQQVEQREARLVVIDSLTGYLNALAQDGELVTQLHELLSYLSNHGVLTILIVAPHGLFGSVDAQIDASYVADTVLLARHFEAQGSLRRCISVLKKRHGNHEKNIREFDICPGGVRIGPPLREFSHILTGCPRYEGPHEELLVTNSPADPPPPST